MSRRSLPTPKQVKKGGMTMFCPVCEDGGRYRIEDITRHPAWCPGPPPVAAAGAEGAAMAETEEERRGAVELDHPGQVGDRALLQAAERARRAAEREDTVRRLRELVVEQQRRVLRDLRTASASRTTTSPSAASPSAPASGMTSHASTSPASPSAPPSPSNTSARIIREPATASSC